MAFKVINRCNGNVTIIIAKSWLDCIKKARTYFGHNFIKVLI